MALIKCHECGEEVSSEALVCPKCGFPWPGQTSQDLEHDTEIRRTYATAGKIAAIKRYRALKKGLGLAEAKGHVESLERKFPDMAASAPKGQGCLPILLSVPLVAMVVYLILRVWS